jgi:hypothetical protein
MLDPPGVGSPVEAAQESCSGSTLPTDGWGIDK